MCLLLAAGGLAASAAGEEGSVSVALSPDTIRVAPGAAFVLELRVDVAGRKFNAYDAVVAYDTAALAFEPPAAARDGEGELMKNACGNTFHRFAARGDSLTVSHVTLCGGVTLSGPGSLHRFGFRALDRPGATAVRLRRVQFYDAGLFVDPARTRDAVVIVSKRGPAEQAVGARVPHAAPGENSFTDVADGPSARGRSQG